MLKQPSMFNLCAWVLISSLTTIEWCAKANSNFAMPQVKASTSDVLLQIITNLNLVPAGLIQLTSISCQDSICYLQGNCLNQTPWLKIKRTIEQPAINLRCHKANKGKLSTAFICQTAL